MHIWTYELWYAGFLRFGKVTFLDFLSYFGFPKSQKVTFFEFLSYFGFLKSQKVTFLDFGSPGPAVSGSKYRKYVILAVSGKNCSQTVVINIAGLLVYSYLSQTGSDNYNWFPETPTQREATSQPFNL